MSKNLTRKGLVLGTAAALVSTAFAGSPASAAGEVVFAPNTGTSYNTFVTDTITLNASLAPGQVAGNIAQLKYSVVTDGSFVVKAVATSATAVTAFSNGATGGYAANLTGVGAVHYAPTTSLVVAPGTPSASTTNLIALSVDSVADATTATTGVVPAATTATKSAVVTAFIDSNNNNVADSGEFSQARTVKFVKYSEVVPVVTLTTPTLGDTSLKATASVGDLSIATAADLTVAFTGATGVDVAPGVVAADGVFTDGTISGISTSTAITAQAYYKTVALGTAVSATAAARTISSIAANVVTGSNAIAAGSASTGNSTTASGTAAAVVVRKNSAWVAQGKVLDTATTPVAKSGVAVVATVSTAGTLSAATASVAAVSVTVNGTTYTAKTGNVVATVNLTSDASGLVSLPVATAGGLTAAVVVKFAAQNYDASVSATPTAESYTVTDDGSAVIRATNKNTAVTYNLSVKDQFSVLSARTNERIKVVAAHVTPGVGIANQFVNVAGGKASFTVTPITDNVTTITVTPTLEVSTVDAGTNVASWATGGTDIAARSIVFRSAAYSFSTAPAIDATNGINNGVWTAAAGQKQTPTTVDQSNTAAVGYVAPAASSTWAKVTLTGSNTGESLTVSGKDLFLSIDGGTVAKSSVSAVAQATAVVVYVASNTAGAKTVTVTNGTVSATVVVTFDVADDNAGTALTLSAVKTIKAGRTLVITGTLVDKFGNVLNTTSTSATSNDEATELLADISVEYDGPGLVVGSLPTETDANGKFTFRVLLGSGDSGAAVVTAKYDANGDADYADTGDLTATSTTLIGVSATITKAATSKVTVKNAEGLDVTVVRGTKSVAKTATSDSYNVSLKGGKGTVKVYVNDILVSSK